VLRINLDKSKFVGKMTHVEFIQEAKTVDKATRFFEAGRYRSADIFSPPAGFCKT
jgi:hypothetical protein